MPKVSVIILNWNGSHYTIPCIKSLFKSSLQNFEIILVDNGSKKEDIEKIEKEFKNNKKIKIIKNKENKGFAEGNNIGVRSSSPESKYALLLNNDTTVGEDYLKEIVGGIESDEKIKVIGCNYSPKSEINKAMTVVGFKTAYSDKNIQGKEIITKLNISGAWLMFDKKLIKEPFDPDYFIYCEDDYLGWLTCLRGYKVAGKRSSNPEAEVIHYGEHKLQKKKSSFAAYLGTRNRLLNLFLFYEKKILIKLLPLIVLAQICYVLFDIRLLPARLKAYYWFLPNFGKVIQKRRKIQIQRNVPDKELMPKLFSCKFRDKGGIDSAFFRKIIDFLNKIFCLYCRLIGIKTVESCIKAKSRS